MKNRWREGGREGWTEGSREGREGRDCTWGTRDTGGMRGREVGVRKAERGAENGTGGEDRKARPQNSLGCRVRE